MFSANYNLLCTISPDLSGLPTTSILNPSGDTFYRGFYSIVLLFGKTEIQAQVAWVENVSGDVHSFAVISFPYYAIQGIERRYATCFSSRASLTDGYDG